MRLQRLTGLERDKILAELAELLEKIARYQAILADEKLVYGIIRDELLEVRSSLRRRAPHRDRRPRRARFDVEDLIADEDMVVTISHQGYIKRNPVRLYRTTGRGGQGANAMETKEEDFVEHLFIASTHSYMLFFTDARAALLAQGARDRAGGPGRQGQGDRQPARAAAGREDRGGDAGARVRGEPVRRHGDRAGRHQEDARSRPTPTRARAASSRSTSTRATS